MIVKDVWVTALKNRTCNACFSGITVGDRYRYVFGGLRNHMFAINICSDCGSVLVFSRHDSPIREESWFLNEEAKPSPREAVYS